jgi:hypothetical protein
MDNLTLNMNTAPVEGEKESSHHEPQSISRGKSSKSNSVKSRKSPKININKQESVELSLSELGIIANKEKINDNTVHLSYQKKSLKSDKSRSDSNDSDDSDVRHNSRKYAKTVKKENKNPDVRKKKMDFMYKISQICTTYKKEHSVSMENTLDDIETEYNKLSNQVQTTKGIDVSKTMLMLTIQGLEMANNKFDPIGVDLHGWSESMSYAMHNKDYDEVLGELYEKYKSTMTVIPEIRLIMMIAGSAAMFAWTKKMTNTNTNVFEKMFKDATNVHRQEDSEPVSIDSSAKINEPEESVDLNAILDKMKTQKKKRGRPPGKTNKPKVVK